MAAMGLGAGGRSRAWPAPTIEWSSKCRGAHPVGAAHGRDAFWRGRGIAGMARSYGWMELERRRFSL